MIVKGRLEMGRHFIVDAYIGCGRQRELTRNYHCFLHLVSTPDHYIVIFGRQVKHNEKYFSF